MKPFNVQYRSAEKFFQDYLQLKSGKLFVSADNPLPLKTRLALNISVPRIDYAFQLNGIVLKIRDRKTAEKLEKPPGMLVHVPGDLAAFFENLDQKLLVDEKYQFLLALCETIDDKEGIIGEDIDEAGAEDDETPSAASTDPSDQNCGPEAGNDSSAGTQLQPEALAISAQGVAAEQTAGEAQRNDGSSGSGGTSDLEKSNLNFEWLREAIAQEEELIEDEPPPEIEAPPTQDKKEPDRGGARQS